MRRKPKPRKIPIVNKEYIWTLDVDNDIHEYKVLLCEDECITYEDGVECKRLKIMNKTQMQGVLQIDCQTKVFDEITDFQLENGIPYIKLEDRRATGSGSSPIPPRKMSSSPGSVPSRRNPISMRCWVWASSSGPCFRNSLPVILTRCSWSP